MGNRQKKKNSAKKAKPTPKKKNEDQANTYKRALFQSPDQLPSAIEKQTPNTQCVQRSKRNLFIESSSEKVNENGKRERAVVRRVSPRKRVNRSLSFHENVPSAEKIILPPTAPATQTMLSGAHKQKMLWASTNALRDEGMKMNHDLFRPCMSVLFKACQKLWLTKVANQALEGSTSENMLALTKQFSVYTIKQLSQDPTAEHMAMVCSNILKMAESTLSFNKPEKSRERSSRTPSKVADDEGNGVQLGRSQNTCTTSGSSSISKLNVSEDNSKLVSKVSPSRQNSIKKTIQHKNSPKKLVSPVCRKYCDLRVMLEPLKNCSGSSKNQESKGIVNSDNCTENQNHIKSPKRDSIESKQLHRITRNKSCDSKSLLSSTKDSLNGETNSIEDGNISESICKNGLDQLNENECKSNSETLAGCSKTLAAPLHSIVSKKIAEELISPETSRRITRRASQLKEESYCSEENKQSRLNNGSQNIENNSQGRDKTPSKNVNNLVKSLELENRSPVVKVAKLSLFSPPSSLSVSNTEAIDKVVTDNRNTEFMSPVTRSKRAAINNSQTKADVGSCTNEPESEKHSPYKNLRPCKPLQRTSRSKSKDSPATLVHSIENDCKSYKKPSNVDLSDVNEKSLSPLKLSSRNISKEDSQQKVDCEKENDNAMCTETLMSPVFVQCGVSNKLIYQKSCDLDSNREEDCETNKENIENNLGKSSTGAKQLFTVATTPMSQLVPVEPINRTLQLYKLSNSGGEDVEPMVIVEPPKLVPHWEQQCESQESAESPPSLQPHWEQGSCSGTTSTSLPESIMAHWQQMSNNANTSDKIMFDFEDTSYEITFPTDNDDTRASSVCAPFEFPHLIDDSKSGFNNLCRKDSTESCDW